MKPSIHINHYPTSYSDDPLPPGDPLSYRTKYPKTGTNTLSPTDSVPAPESSSSSSSLSSSVGSAVSVSSGFCVSELDVSVVGEGLVSDSLADRVPVSVIISPVSSVDRDWVPVSVIISPASSVAGDRVPVSVNTSPASSVDRDRVPVIVNTSPASSDRVPVSVIISPSPSGSSVVGGRVPVSVKTSPASSRGGVSVTDWPANPQTLSLSSLVSVLALECPSVIGYVLDATKAAGICSRKPGLQRRQRKG